MGRDLTLSRKLSYFNGRFRRLCRRLPDCPERRSQALEPLIRCCGAAERPPGPDRGRRGWSRGAWALTAALTALCSLLLGLSHCPLLRFCGRALLIQVLPYWDWTLYHNMDCLIGNPYYSQAGAKSMQPVDCVRACQAYQVVERLQNADAVDVLQNYLRQNRPLVIVDGMTGWAARSDFSVESLTQLYSEHLVLQSSTVCSYWASENSPEHSPASFLQHVHRQTLTQWTLQWKNCNKAAAKVIRTFYQRPYFLPPMVELAESNWLLMASRAEGSGMEGGFVKVDDHDGDLLLWIAQVQGVFEVQLLPRDACADTCAHHALQLSPGETVSVPLQMWEVQYRPITSTAIGLAATGNWLQDPS
uniref:Uncharacterized protein n=1 Tax=Callorhinchus milii TaxID=7868 RepID=V9KLT4_CALMI|eukprot:gi/632983585/ref/XP_007908720.1/ PREDICTED: uncharacterized protein LOC103189948 [Callorhinchus milii]